MSRRNNGKRLVAALAILIVVLCVCVWFAFASGNKESDEIQVSVETKETTKATEAPTVDPHIGQTRSKLTGEWVSENTSNNVPLAVMYSNIYDAMPQSSIGSADIVFESLVEGGITRLCCLFDNKTDLDKIGPVRSCRTYYLLFAKEFEAIYVHFGYSEYAESYLSQSKFHSLDGMVYCNFYRTNDRIAPHNAYTSWSGIMDSAEYRGYSTTYPDGYTSPYVFNTDDNKDVEISGGEKCLSFVPGYPYNNPWFEYDDITKKYLRFQFEGPQIDSETGEQLSFKNILVKYVNPAYYPNGTPNYDIAGSGNGLFITDGKAVSVKWVKESETTGATRYYYSDGSEVELNQGKTFICQVETSQEVQIRDYK